ncbi:hypothetical protein ACLB2K_063761 [Fragaria x ananassa]
MAARLARRPIAQSSLFRRSTLYDSSLTAIAERLSSGEEEAAGPSETDIINVVEQRIWHSMEEGQFENLPGKGKPLDLSSNSNPHADPAADTLYRILSKNGCAPRWVELNKEIRMQAAEWRTEESLGEEKW